LSALEGGIERGWITPLGWFKWTYKYLKSS
jgi:hypothetical protein